MEQLHAHTGTFLSPAAAPPGSVETRPPASPDIERWTRLSLGYVALRDVVLDHIERKVRIAEQQGELIAQVIRSIRGDLGLSSRQQSEAPAVVRRHLLALAG